MTKQQTATPVYKRQRGLTIEQLNAIDQLVLGHTDQATADAVGLHRTTVTRWRLYDPWFEAALNRQRADLWGTAAERLRGLLPRALDVLAGQLNDPDHALQAAIATLKLAGLEKIGAPRGETDPERIVDALALERELDRADETTRLLATLNGGKPSESSRAAMIAEIDNRLAEE